MESNNNNKNTNYEQEEQQLRKRKFNELDNDSQPITEEEHKQHQPPEKLSKKKCDGQQENDALLEVCILHCWPKIIGIS
jgi:hypothetical protein